MSQPLDEHPPPGPNNADQPPQPTSTPASQETRRATLGDRLRAARYAARLTQEGLADGDFSKSYISAVERSKMTPSIAALRLLADRLGVTLAYLLGEEQLHLESPDEQARPASQNEFAQRLHEAEQWLRREDASAALGRLGAPEAAGTFGTAYQARWHSLYAWALLQQGRAPEAEVVVARGLETAQTSQDRRAEAYLSLIRALATAGHDDEAAEQAFQHAIAIGEHIGDNALRSSGHGEYGAFLAERGRYQEAYEHISLSQTAANRLGSMC
jgi:transcriptional regulator with XRE-family HTH domain